MIYSEIDNPKCRLCAYADAHSSNGNMTCSFKGAVPEDFCCRKFKYDIFKREIKPHKVMKKANFSKEDFTL